jgi:hypothetical protein
VAWLLPELEVGEEPELRPLELELLELLELEEDEPELEGEPELVEPELVEPELVEPELVEPELVEPELDEPEEDVPVVCVEPGRAKASAPAVTTLAMVTAVVVDRTLFRPCSLAAMARRIPSRGLLLMLPSCVRGLGNPCTNLLGNL